MNADKFSAVMEDAKQVNIQATVSAIAVNTVLNTLLVILLAQEDFISKVVEILQAAKD